jgi:hypothetical protein
MCKGRASFSRRVRHGFCEDAVATGAVEQSGKTGNAFAADRQDLAAPHPGRGGNRLPRPMQENWHGHCR